MPIIHARLAVILFLSGRILLFKVISHRPDFRQPMRIFPFVDINIFIIHEKPVAVFNYMF